jgi:pimeloyl-ACP methyl ester carboxylesterase
MCAGVINVTGGSLIELLRINSLFRPLLGSWLASRMPSLLNTPGITQIEGVDRGAPHFFENMPLRDGLPLSVTLADGTVRQIRSPVTNDVDSLAATPSFNPPYRMSKQLPTVVNGWTVGAGHFNQLEVPDQVNAMIEGFLRHHV